MFIYRRTSQHRRDFHAMYRCQFCGNESEGGGYDDRNFHHNVIPYMKCKRCGKSSDGVITSEPIVPEGVVM